MKVTIKEVQLDLEGDNLGIFGTIYYKTVLKDNLKCEIIITDGVIKRLGFSEEDMKRILIKNFRNTFAGKKQSIELQPLKIVFDSSNNGVFDSDFTDIDSIQGYTFKLE